MRKHDRVGAFEVGRILCDLLPRLETAIGAAVRLDARTYDLEKEVPPKHSQAQRLVTRFELISEDIRWFRTQAEDVLHEQMHEELAPLAAELAHLDKYGAEPAQLEAARDRFKSAERVCLRRGKQELQRYDATLALHKESVEYLEEIFGLPEPST